MSVLRRLATWVPFGRVPEVAPEALLAELEGDAAPLVVDVRTQLEWQQSRIGGALSVPLPSLPSRLGELEVHRERRVVTICLSAHRSVAAVRLLRERGFADVRQLQGGMLAWWARKLPTESGAG
jgi:rhodanese-related sulfurtransferase